MLLVGFLLFVLIIESLFRFSVKDQMESLIYFFHFHCLERIPLASSSAFELKAIACGENFSTAASSQIFMASGLIHLFVVSGAHLIVLEKMITSAFFTKYKIPKSFVLFILFIYTLACDMNSPITRSFLSILLSFILLHKHLYWTDNYKLFLMGLLTLIINPLWLNSLSLQMSWMAALILSINSLYFFKAGILFKQFLFFLFLWPFLIFFQIPSPSIIIANLIFTPILEFFLFPLALLIWLCPFLYFLFDFIILYLKNLLHLFEFQLIYQEHPVNLELVLFGWIFILGMHYVLYFTELKQRRQNHV